MYLPLFVGVLCSSLFWYALLCVFSSFAIILTRERDICLVTLNALWLFLAVPWVGLQFVIAVFLDHTHLLTEIHEKIPACKELAYRNCIKG